MKGSLFVLKSVADFAPGAFENTGMENGSIQLGRSGMAYLPSGCYTSPAFSLQPFLRVQPSWNADTPQGTAVEVQVRIASGGQWSRWFSFGKWSPFIDRSSPKSQQDEMGKTEVERILVDPRHAPADIAQMRVCLYSDDSGKSPKVRLLALTAEPLRGEEGVGERTTALLEIPRYSCLVRDPSIAQRIPSATSIAMLMNRWGEDALPEEVARAMYDSGSGRYGNVAFATAVAGAYGFECYAWHTTISQMREEVRKGRAVGALVSYKADLMQDEEQNGEYEDDLKLEGAVMDSVGHIVVVRGFEKQDGHDVVVVNDPMVTSDGEVERRWPVETFKRIYKGVALVLRKGQKHAGSAKPQRVVAELQTDQYGLRLMRHGKVLFPGQVSLEEVGGITVCYTLPEEIAFASAAQKKFYYLTLNENGAFGFDAESVLNQKISFYLVGSRGRTWVAEKVITQADADVTTVKELPPNPEGEE